MKQEIKRKILVLLDAHAIIHRAYHALPEFTSSKGEPTGGLYGIATMLMKIIKELNPDYLIACFDLPEPTFRKEMYKEYKAGRQKADESLVRQIERSRDIFAAFNIPIYEKVGFEADDVIGTIVENLKSEKSHLKIIIASGDMDTLQLVCDDDVVVYTLKKGLNDTILYNEKAVKERFLGKGFVVSGGTAALDSVVERKFKHKQELLEKNMATVKAGWDYAMEKGWVMGKLHSAASTNV